MEQSKQYYCCSLLTKALEVLRWQVNLQKTRRRKLERFAVKREARITENIFDAWDQFVRDRLKVQIQFKRVKQMRVRRQRRDCFIIWRKRFIQKESLKPLKEIVPHLYAKTLMLKAIKGLYNYRSYRIIRNNMKATALQYREKEVLRKVMGRLYQNSVTMAAIKQP